MGFKLCVYKTRFECETYQSDSADESFLTLFGSQEARLCIVQEELTALEITNIIMRQEILHPAALQVVPKDQAT